MTETRRVAQDADASGEAYDAQYFATRCGVPYERSQHWLGFFGAIAEHIASDLAPRTVLDAGCAMGFLVEALRDRGVDAQGIDVSEYALGRVRDDVRPHVRRASITEPLPQQYDLIVCIEVLEHLPAPDAEAAVANICAHTDDVVFSSTPTHIDEPTHINVQPPDYWAALFGRHGFHPDQHHTPDYVAPWAVRFRRVARMLDDSQRALDAARTETLRLSTDLSLTEHLLVSMDGRVRALTAEVERLQALQNSVTWRMGESLQRRAHSLAPPGTRRGRAAHRAFRAAMVVTEEGAGEAARRAARKLRARTSGAPAPALLTPAIPDDPFDAEYHAWLERRTPAAAALQRMGEESERWPLRPLVSVVMPVYNSNLDWLRQAIESVRAQSYTHWELCVADDASPRQEVRDLLSRYAAEDARIRTVFRERNGGIAAASNDALGIAEGGYVALLDHDDVLVPHALHRMVEHVIAHPEHGLVYSDEDKLRPDGRRGFVFFKPDWSPDLLLSVNYVCHLTMMRRDLVTLAGGFREGYDGSQDYDLFLRVVDLGTGVGHVPDVLYSWRMIPGSTALAGGAKPLAWENGRRAIQDSLDRRGEPARVDAARVPGRYEVRRRIRGNPQVAILIPTRDRVDLLRTCIDSIEQRSTYANHRIVIVDNDSRDPATLEYLAQCGHQVVPQPGPFNYSRIVNAGVAAAPGEHLLLLNNDIEVIAPEWIEVMLEHSQRPEVGAVGARLLYTDGAPQHEGVSVGTGFIAGNLNHGEYFALGLTTQDKAAVTGACMMLRREVFEETGGFDEGLRVAFNDVDFCLRLRQRGYWIVYAPQAELYHHESASRGKLHPMEDEKFFVERWGTHDQLRDPFVNANLWHINPFRTRP